jgi:hypothetical protein
VTNTGRDAANHERTGCRGLDYNRHVGTKSHDVASCGIREAGDGEGQRDGKRGESDDHTLDGTGDHQIEVFNKIDIDVPGCWTGR